MLIYKTIQRKKIKNKISIENIQGFVPGTIRNLPERNKKSGAPEQFFKQRNVPRSYPEHIFCSGIGTNGTEHGTTNNMSKAKYV